MTEQPDDLDAFNAKLKAARERIGESDSGELAREGTSLGYGCRLSIELLAGLLVKPRRPASGPVHLAHVCDYR